MERLRRLFKNEPKQLPEQTHSATSKDAKNGGTPGQQEEGEDLDDDFDWNSDDEEEERFAWKTVFPRLRSIFLIHLVNDGFPKEQRGLLYFLMIQFHEQLYSPLTVYSALPSLAMWYYPDLRPRHVYAVTQGIDIFKGIKFTSRELIILTISVVISSLVCDFLIDFRGISEALEPVFGAASTWPAAFYPMIPGMFLRAVHERPNSINGFVPEAKQGIVLAVFARACAAILPQTMQWWIFAAYSSPSVEYPVMFIEWIFCLFCWVCTETSPLAAYALWLLVNQYRHTYTWFKNYGGGPSVVLLRERRGTLWYITALIVLKIIELEAGQTIIESEVMTLPPQTWIPMALVLVLGLYLLKYGLMLRIYKYEYKPLQKGKDIRLLRLRAQPCLPNSPVQCDMIHTSLRNPPQYSAVSHRWESNHVDREMILIDGGLFPVSRGIFSFLKANRSNAHSKYYWIDSISINQEDKLEKSKQVGMMRNIFEEAELTLGWLGDTPGAKKAFALVDQLTKVSTVGDIAQICSQPNSGWNEFQSLLLNDWFQRVWIIQEVAVARARLLCCGNAVLSWQDLAKVLTLITQLSIGADRTLSSILHQPQILSALIMEEFRYRIVNVDLIKLKDTLKLSLAFKTTLPIDKVYALLGLVDERHTPLFHPKFGLEGKKIVDYCTVVKDLGETMSLIGELLGTATGRSNSRRARAIRSGGTASAARYVGILVRDMQRLTTRLDVLLKEKEKGISEVEASSMQPDYSGKSTTRLVYTYVARDLVKQGDALSFIRYAGLGFPQDEGFIDSPSWVPNWTMDLPVYLLPWRKRVTRTDTVDKPSKDAVKPPAAIRDGGPNLLLVNAVVVGIITHVAPLTHDFVFTDLATSAEAEDDSTRLASKFEYALDLAKRHVRCEYQTDDAFEKGFCDVLTAGMPGELSCPALCLRHWAEGSFAAKFERTPLRARSLREYYDEKSQTYEAENSHALESDIVKKYSLIRYTSSSAISKLAHMIRADVAPSVSEYCRTGKKKAEEIRSSIFDQTTSNPLAGYAPYVDYTIGRSFIITESGLIGLSPAESREGDLIVQVQSKDRIVWLTLREDTPEAITTMESDLGEAGKLSDSSDEQSKSRRTVRLVGEAYVNELARKDASLRDLEQFEVR